VIVRRLAATFSLPIIRNINKDSILAGTLKILLTVARSRRFPCLISAAKRIARQQNSPAIAHCAAPVMETILGNEVY
jgi:hypothetical protein